LPVRHRKRLDRNRGCFLECSSGHYLTVSSHLDRILRCQRRCGRDPRKGWADVQTLASAVDQYQAHMGAPPATLAELTSPATNARGQTAGPYLSSIPSSSPRFSHPWRAPFSEHRADHHLHV